MRSLVKILATAGGAGYSPIAPGTMGSAVGLLLGVVWPAQTLFPIQIIVLVGTFVLASLVSTAAERAFKTHDPSYVVIDEVWGMWAILAVRPDVVHVPWLLAAAFVGFRIFDVLKPPPLKWLSRAPEGWGIMLDDLGASAYTIGVLWLLTTLIGR